MAARKSARRRPPTANPKQPDCSDPPPEGTRTASSAAAHRCLPSLSSLIIFLYAALCILVPSVVMYRIRNRAPASTPPVLSVYERGLVKSDTSFREILAENTRIPENRSHRHFPNPVLAYITPWNSRGYEMAKLFSSRLTHLSPVWYELKSEGKKLSLEGRHNADREWISELRMIGHSLLLPRVVVEALPSELLLKKKQWSKAIDAILMECKEMGYDGIVLESWSRWAAYGVLHDPDMRSMALQFVKQLGKALHSLRSMKNAAHHLELIYVIPAPGSDNLVEYDFGPQDLQQLAGDVDGFSLMTYDFSGPQSPGPNAPLAWVHSSMRLLLGDTDGDSHSLAYMIFLGINFYGNDFRLSEGLGGGAIVGTEYVSLLEKHRPVLNWDDRSAEHFFIYSDKNGRHAVFYPSLKSISVRLDEARSWGAGLSIWEIGQGLDYFFDLL